MFNFINRAYAHMKHKAELKDKLALYRQIFADIGKTLTWQLNGGESCWASTHYGYYKRKIAETEAAIKNLKFNKEETHATVHCEVRQGDSRWSPVGR